MTHKNGAGGWKSKIDALGRNDSLTLISLASFGAVFVALLWRQTYPAGSGGATQLVDWMSALIHPLIIWGWLQGRTALVTLRTNATHLERVLEEGEMLRARGGQAEFGDLRRLIGFDDGHSPAAHRMMVQIVEDAEVYVFEHRETLMLGYKAEISAVPNTLALIQSLALRLGILGTFVGLVLAIGSMAQAVGLSTAAGQTGGNAGQLSKDMAPHFRGLMSALGIAFGTSIAGLQVWLVLTLLSMRINKRIDSINRKLAECAGLLLTIARRAKRSDTELLASLAQVTNQVQVGQHRMDDLADEVERSLKAAGGRMDAQTAAFCDAMVTLSTLKEEWVGTIEAMRKSQAELGSEFQHLMSSQLAATLESREAADRQADALARRLESEMDRFLSGSRSVLDQLAVSRLPEDIAKGVAQAASHMESAIVKMAEDMRATITDLHGEIRSSVDANTALTRKLVDVSDILSDTLRKNPVTTVAVLSQWVKFHSPVLIIGGAAFFISLGITAGLGLLAMSNR